MDHVPMYGCTDVCTPVAAQYFCIFSPFLYTINSNTVSPYLLDFLLWQKNISRLRGGHRVSVDVASWAKKGVGRWILPLLLTFQLSLV